MINFVCIHYAFRFASFHVTKKIKMLVSFLKEKGDPSVY